MFLQHYGLREEPFGVTPDPRYLYLGEMHREALASLIYGVESGRGFLALIAPPGMGKTTLLFHLLERFQRSAQTAFLFQTQCDSREFMRFLMAEVGMEIAGKDMVTMHQEFNSMLVRGASAGKRFIVVIDEAQNLDDSVLETVRLLSDFETSRTKLLQIVLAGQNSLASKLATPALMQLRQRLSMVIHLDALSPEEAGKYIDHRLQVAGYRGPDLLTPEARALLISRSEGVPRNINTLCFNALSLGFALDAKVIDERMVREVADDIALRGAQRATPINWAPIARRGPGKSSRVERHGADGAASRNLRRAPAVEPLPREQSQSAAAPHVQPFLAATAPQQFATYVPARPPVHSPVASSEPAPHIAPPHVENEPSNGLPTHFAAHAKGYQANTAKCSPPESPLAVADPVGANTKIADTETANTARANADAGTEGAVHELPKPIPIDRPAKNAETSSDAIADALRNSPYVWGSVAAEHRTGSPRLDSRFSTSGSTAKLNPRAIALGTLAFALLGGAVGVWRQYTSSAHDVAAANDVAAVPASPANSATSMASPAKEVDRDSGESTQRSRPAPALRMSREKQVTQPAAPRVQSSRPSSFEPEATTTVLRRGATGNGSATAPASNSFVSHNVAATNAETSTNRDTTRPAPPPASNIPVPAAQPGPASAGTVQTGAGATPAASAPPPSDVQWNDPSNATPTTTELASGSVPSAASVGDQRVSQISQVELLHSTTPEYPTLARQLKLEGMVVLKAVITKNGSVQFIERVSGNPVLAGAAIKAVREWRYRPASLNGQPIDVDTEIVVKFALRTTS
ncbi:MAG TPA: TonB family protein [Clostridia bacterium]|nr:TonB family protein [Clostridia bacterium]